MDKNCAVCGIVFHLKPSHFDGRHCCSKKCQSERFKTTLKGAANPNYKGKDKIIYTCANCNSPFLTRRPQFPTKCCSKKCSTEWVGKQHKGKIISKETIEKQKTSKRLTFIKRGVVDLSIRKTCACGNIKDQQAKTCVSCWHKKIETKFYCVMCGALHKKHKTKTCSPGCRTKMMSEMYSLHKNPNWKGGVKPEHQRQRNHLSYKEWRFSVYKRDKYTCQDCGKSNCYLHAHHIKEFSKHPELRTDVNNGKTLCVDCHKVYHPSMNIKRYKPQISC